MMTISRSPGYRVKRVGTFSETEPVEGGPATAAGISGTADTAGAAGTAGTAGSAAGASDPAVGTASAGTTSAATATTTGGRSGRGRKSLRTAAHEAPVLAAIAALGVAGTIGFGLAWGLSDHGGTPTTAVTNSARNLVLALTNFDPGTVNADFAQIQSDATGTFAGQAHRFFGATIRKELTSAGAASRGTIDDLYVQSVSGNHATVFAVVSQKYLNKDASSPVNDTLRMVIGLTDVNGWKVSSVQVLQQPVSAPVSGPSSSGSGSGTTTHSTKTKSKS